MDPALTGQWPMAQDEPSADAIGRVRRRIARFVRSRVPDPADAEDILQDVFYEFVEAYRMMRPVEQVTAWLFRVARNRITDLFRRKEREADSDRAVPIDGDGERIADLLPSPDAGPEAAFAHRVLL